MSKLLNTKEAATYLGYKPQALIISRQEGKTLSGIVPPPHVKIGGKTIRYKLADLEKWVEQLTGE